MSDPTFEAARWMNAIWGPVSAAHNEFFEVSVKKPGAEAKWVSSHMRLPEMLRGADETGPLMRIANTGADVYAGMVGLTSAPQEGRGGSALRGHAAVLWLDLDCDAPGRKMANLFENPAQALSAVDTVGRTIGLGAPGLVVDSGWGLHVGWLLATPIPAAHASIAVRAITEALRVTSGKHIDNVSDVTRVLRVPGTLNWRAGGPGSDSERPVTLVRCEDAPEQRLGWMDVRAALGLTNEALEAAQALSARIEGSAPWVGRPFCDPGSLFEEVMTWADVLEPFGWTQGDSGWASRQGEEWFRPGALPTTGHTRSGMVYPDSGLLVVYSNADETGLRNLRRSGDARTAAGTGVIDKWRAWIDLAWTGDWLSATQSAQNEAWALATTGEQTGGIGLWSWSPTFIEALADEYVTAIEWATHERRRTVLLNMSQGR